MVYGGPTTAGPGGGCSLGVDPLFGPGSLTHDVGCLTLSWRPLLRHNCHGACVNNALSPPKSPNFASAIAINSNIVHSAWRQYTRFQNATNVDIALYHVKYLCNIWHHIFELMYVCVYIYSN